MSVASTGPVSAKPVTIRQRYPMHTPIVCPMSVLRGEALGAVGVLKKRKAVGPSEGNTKCEWVRTPAVAIIPMLIALLIALKSARLKIAERCSITQGSHICMQGVTPHSFRTHLLKVDDRRCAEKHPSGATPRHATISYPYTGQPDP